MLRNINAKITTTAINDCLRLYELLESKEDYSRFLGKLIAQHASNELRRILNERA